MLLGGRGHSRIFEGWGAFSVGYAISAKCFEEEASNKLPYFGSFSSVYSCAALLDLKIAQRQTLKK